MFTRLIQITVSVLFFTSTVFATDGFVKFDFDVFKGLNLGSALANVFDDLKDGLTKDLSKRDNGSSVVSVQNEKAFYISELTIGATNSKVKVLLDTGSADLWVMSAKNPHCEDNGGDIDCEQYGTYNETASSTFKSNDTNFYISYGDNTFANGTWGQDTISLNDELKIEGANFAVADNSDSTVGVFGIGYKDLESSDSTYDNVPAQLKSQGLIKKIAYSLYLTGAESEKGSILFGGIDNAKYSGELQTIDITKTSGEYVYSQIPLTNLNINITSNSSAETDSSSSSTTSATKSTSGKSITDLLSGLSGSSSTTSTAASTSSSSNDPIDLNNADALLDSGTTLSYFQQSTVDEIISQIQPGAQYDSSIGGYQVSCTLKQEGNSMNFNFNNQVDIEVPFTDLIVESGTDSSTGDRTCMLGVVPGDMIILGDNFLRSAYTVFNLDEKTISLAQMNYTDDESIQVIE